MRVNLKPIRFIVISLELLVQHCGNLSQLFVWRKQAKFGCNNFKGNLGFRPFVETYIRVLWKDTHLQKHSIVKLHLIIKCQN